MHKSPFRLMAVLASAALVLSACGTDDDATDDDTDNGAAAGGDDTDDDEATDGGGDRDGGLTIGIKYDQPGLGLMDGDTPSGLDVDVAIAVAEGLDYSEDQITWKESPSAQRETLLDTGQVDMIFATYSITDERKETVQFAGPYFVAGQDLLVVEDSEIAGPEDFTNEILCSVTGSTSAANVQEDYPDLQLQEYGTYSECVEQLANGTIDALTTDDVILAGFAAQEQYEGQLKVAGTTFSEENYGVGLPKDGENCEEINEIINGLWEDGTMEQILEDNLGAADYTPNEELNPPDAGGHCG